MGQLKPYRPPPVKLSQEGGVALLHKKVKEIDDSLKYLQEKCTRLCNVTYSHPERRKRKQ